MRGILCNWLVCMAVYMASFCKDLGGKMIAIWCAPLIDGLDSNKLIIVHQRTVFFSLREVVNVQCCRKCGDEMGQFFSPRL